MAPEVPRVCATCEFWRRPDPVLEWDGFGACAVLSVSPVIRIKGASQVETTQDFGCNQWEWD